MGILGIIRARHPQLHQGGDEEDQLPPLASEVRSPEGDPVRSKIENLMRQKAAETTLTR